MSDTDSDILLLHAFVHLDASSKQIDAINAAWKRGDSDTIDRLDRQEFRDAPSINQRILLDRTRLWLPKVENYLKSGKTWMVVAGVSHMSGSDRLPAKLRAQGYQIEQL